jgi:hypothetical protein
MKNLLLVFLIIITFFSCKNEAKKETTKNQSAYASFGDKITPDKALTKEKALSVFKSLKKGDTVSIKFQTKINSSCQNKGCWMRLDLGDDNETLVRFKDYGFFVPLNAQGKEVIVNGKAYLDVVSVDELRHYAKDEGLSEEEINKINKEEITYAIESDGVLLAE